MTFFIVSIIVTISFSLLLILTEIKVDIKDFEFKIKNKNCELNKKCIITFKLCIFNKLNYLKIRTNIDKLKLSESNNKYNKIKRHVVKNDSIKVRDIQNKLKVKYEKIDLNITIGEENAAVSAILTGVISSIVSVIIGKHFSDIKEIKWNVEPMYNINVLKLSLNCIINIKLIHIINTIIMMRKKGDKNARTSNRKNLKYIYE